MIGRIHGGFVDKPPVLGWLHGLAVTDVRAPANWPRVGTDCPALGAHHPWPERRHREVIREMVDVHDRCVPALIAVDPQRSHAVLAHVREVHRLDHIGEAGGGQLA